ncbi:MAG: RelA/spoT family protein [Erysipelotrichaceae bacterium]
MRLVVFDVIDEALNKLETNHDNYELVRNDINEQLHAVFKDKDDCIVDIVSRLKRKESLREKIIRNRLYIKYKDANEILDHLQDLIGLTIECRFIEEEYLILKVLREKFTLKYNDTRYSYSEEYENIYIDVTSSQPQVQKNGFAIYRLDGFYLRNGNRVNFELQIKALVHSFWSEIEHKLVYKNTNFYVYNDFMKDILASIKANLSIMDRQLNIVYNRMHDTSENEVNINENTFEVLIAKAINDLFAVKMNESIGFTLDIKNTSSILGHYIFLKDLQFNGNNGDRIASLFRTFKKLNNIKMDFENEIALEWELKSDDVFVKILGNHLISIINKDYDWFVFFKILFAIEPGNNIEDFTLFMNVIKNYLVDNYWLNTSFVKLSMEDSDKIHRDCTEILAKSLVELSTIKIIHNDFMSAINKAFVKFIEELELRVINYEDFKSYSDAYYQDWVTTLKKIFDK